MFFVVATTRVLCFGFFVSLTFHRAGVGTRQVLDWAPDARTRSAPTTTRGVCAVDMTTGASGPGGASEVCQETVGMESILLFPTEGDLILAKRPQT